MRELVLTSECLLSKWGFNDGDEPDALLDHLGRDDYLPGDTWHRILRRLVREHLVPELQQDVEVVDVDTNHNPIRARTVDGVDVTHLWHKSQEPRPDLMPESVRVPIDVVVRIVEEETADV